MNASGFVRSVALLCVGLWLMGPQPEGTVSQSTAATRATPPPAGVDAAVPYAFAVMDGADPAGWSSCRAVTVGFASAGAPKGAAEVLRRALDELSSRTGLAFHLVDAVSARPDRGWARRRAEGAEAGPDVLIAWLDPADTDMYERGVIGVVGVAYTAYSGEVSGRRILAAAVALHPGAWNYDVLLHELGHVAGLAHTDDPRQVMHPVASRGRAAFSLGDAHGLAQLTEPCH